MRQCGSCSLCCKVLSVNELDKPVNKWCSHAKKGGGCTIYGDHPQECKVFNCLWLQGALTKKERPDKIHAVLSITNDGKNLVIHEDTPYRGSGAIALKDKIRDLLKDGQKVIIVDGDSRRMLL